MSFTILTGKEGNSPKKPLFLVSIVAPDGDIAYLTSAAYYGAASIVYGGNTYLARIKKNDIQAIQASGAQGFDTVPGFTLTIADADKSIWTNHCFPHGWRGAVVTLTVIMWDVVANAYSTDAMQWIFIGGNPQHNYSTGETTVDVQGATNFTRLKVPSVPLEYRCPWTFPTNATQRSLALNDATSIYFQCGYSPDQSGGVGNYASGTTPFTTCDLTRSSATDPSVGCMARMGDRADTSISPDGNLLRDIAGHPTGRFGGNTWIAPAQYSGRNYTSGSKVFGFNQPNTAIPGSYINTVYGTQWVSGMVLAPAGEANSLRSEVLVCEALYGQVNVLKVVVNGVELPKDNTGDPLFTWRYITQGGRNGNINRDNIYNSAGLQGPDPGGSLCKIEFVVPVELANPGSVPTCQVLVTGPPLLRFDNVGNASFVAPDLFDAGGTIGNSVSGPAANLVWAVLDLIQWGNVTLSQLDWPSWYAASQIAATSITYTSANGTTQSHAQFKASFALLGSNRQTLAQVLTAVRNAGNLMIAPNPANGLIQCFVRQTLADQQPSAVPGSNTTSPTTSVTAAGATANGYFAYLFDETNIDEDSFKVTTTPIASTPNTVSFQFQDEQNGYTQDSITEIDPTGYAYSGNQEISVPVPLMGVPNFDQATRVANVQLAEAQFGNPRNDPGGTLYFEFTCNQRVLHLTNRLGYICGLTWQALGIGGTPGALTSPQPVRIISLKPDTDGEKWQVKCAWHYDFWYEYAYGQNPAPFQTNPLLGPPNRPPYPWQPAMTQVSDIFSVPSVEVGPFNLYLDTTQYPAQITAAGHVPVNVQQSTKPPLVPLQASTANTGGSLAPGSYTIMISANGANGPVSNLINCTVPAGTNTNTITVSGIQWLSGAAPNVEVFVGTNIWNMVMLAGTITGSLPDSNGNPTQITFYDDIGLLGLPDIAMSEFAVIQTPIAHGGIWGDALTSFVLTGGGPHFGAAMTFAAGAWTTNEFAGRTITRYCATSGAFQQGISRFVASNGTNIIDVTHAGAFTPGDVFVMRTLADTFSSNTIGDSLFVNSYAPAGMTVNGEIGNLVQIIGGTGAWSAPKTIIANTATVLTIAGTFDVTPDATSIFIVLYPAQIISDSSAITNDGTGTTPLFGTTVATVPAGNKPGIAQSMLITVATADAHGNYAPLRYQPSRELYIPLQSLSSISSSITDHGSQISY